MNSASPLIPQGSNLEQQSKARSSLKVKIFCALGANVAVLLVLLMQGCKREQPQAVEDPYANYNSGVFTDTNPPAIADTNAAAYTTDTNTYTSTTPTQPVQPEQPYVPPTTPVVPETSATEYAIQKGDTFSTIAPKFKISVKALQEANPTVDPSKLQIGKKLMIPATTSAATTPSTPVIDTATGVTTHTVKSGDTLGKLATDYHTTVKAIQAANGLTDTRIKVGQKLKIPAK